MRHTMFAMLALMLYVAPAHAGFMGESGLPAQVAAAQEPHPTDHGAVLYEDKGTVIMPPDEGPATYEHPILQLLIQLTMLWGG